MSEPLPENIVAESPEMRAAVAMAVQVAAADVTVLITGESGTGKEVVASLIHKRSKRREKNFVPVNCGAIASGVLESELFGHEKGSFTGASGERKGYFETASGGTIFLDEIGEMPLETQVKLLRVLESGEVQRVGASKAIKIDVRVIAATNKRLTEEIETKRFREDLYFRLRTVEIVLPPLRSRPADILRLTEKFVRDFERKHGLKFTGFTAEATELLLSHPWPGNVRELRNLIESLIVLEQTEKITAERLEKYLHRDAPPAYSLAARHTFPPDERELIYRALLQLEMQVAEMKTMLAELVAGRSEPPRLLLPAAAAPDKAGEDDVNREAEEKLTAKTLRGMLQSFYDAAEKQGEMPSLPELERYAIEQALKKFKGNKRKTAEALGITERTLYRKLAEKKSEEDNDA
ncbi:MAG: sigma-54-dependent Fis family transcriptional regulator [Rhizobacter sp.]|nr:sigma-54-dependent Fis family transcriptional regulator [Chlorobiales bacterium]